MDHLNMYGKDVQIIHSVRNPVKLLFGQSPDALSINDRFVHVCGHESDLF